MCKLNILCLKNDGECTCELISQKLLPDSQPKNGLLCSILSYIKSQPEIMKSLVESSNNSSLELPQNSPEVPSLDQGDSSPTQNSSNDCVADFSVNIISDLPNKYFVGHGFSLMVEVVDKNFLKFRTEEPLNYQVVIVSKADGKELEILGEVSTSGVALFRKLTIQEKWKSVLLQVRVKERADISQFSSEILVRAKKSKLGLKNSSNF